MSFSASRPCHAEEGAAAAVSSTGSPTSQQGLELSAYFDVYYAHNFNRPQPLSPPTTPSAPLPDGGTNLHSYDLYTNQLGLGLAELTVKHARKQTTLLIDFDFGHTADLAASSFASQSAQGGPSVTFVDEVSKHIGQAVLSYSPESVPGSIIEVGKMPTHVGLESLKPKDNWNYSRSLVFTFATPLWHTGLHVGIPVIRDKVMVSAYAYNGWNTIYENNSQPTWGAQLKWTPNEQMTFYYDYIGGPEQPGNNNDWRQVHEVSGTITSGLVSLATDLASGRESNPPGLSIERASWTAWEIMAKVAPTPRYYLSPRFEIYHDPSGYTLGGGPQSAYTATLTNSYEVSTGLETRLELRTDYSTSGQRFITKDGFSSNQTSVVLGILYRT